MQRLIMVFVVIEEDGDDRFYILKWQRLRDILVRMHKKYLAAHGGARPKRPDSLHSAIKEEHLRPYRDRWDTVEDNLR